MVHILYWNPDISSMTRDCMTDEMTEIVSFGGYFNWSGVHSGRELPAAYEKVLQDL